MKIAILGTGLNGKRRALAASAHELIGIYDPVSSKAKQLAEELHTSVFQSEDTLLASDAEIVIISTPHNKLQPLALKALRAGKHVLVDKPAAISVSQIEELEKEAHERKLAVKVGFNLRFHPAILKTRQYVVEGKLGPLMFMRVRYGHGGRPGMEKEWRMQPELSGGGELMDQGVHILDLIYWFFGPLSLQSAHLSTSFWKTSVEDNAVVTVSDKTTWATFHTSASEWKNTFSLELYGRSGKILVNGLGSSYGQESMTFYRMLPQMGPPEIEYFEFPSTSGTDESLAKDLANLIEHLEKGSVLLGDLSSAKYSLEQVRSAYRACNYMEMPCSA